MTHPNPAPTDLDVLAAIRARYSAYTFADRAVEPADLTRLFEAARWSFSSYNEQPWRYIVGAKDRDPETWDKLFDCLVEGNQGWARTAPVLVMTCASMRHKRNDTPNAKAFHDLGAANMCLALQAAGLGIQVHAMGGYIAEKVQAHFQLPDGYEPHAALALGYPGDPATLDEPLKSRVAAPRQRLPLDEIVFGGTWGEPAPGLGG